MAFTREQQLKTRNFWRKRPKLVTKELRDLIHGYMMGDGSLTSRGGLQVMQSLKQLNWVEWMYERLNPLRTDTAINKDQQIYDERTEKTTYSARFTTRALLKGFRSMWYEPALVKRARTGQNTIRKKLPNSINAIMNPNVLTLWYAGDGSKIIGSRGAKIESTGFNTEEHLLLQAILKRKLGLDTSLNKAGKAKSGTPQFTINFNAEIYPKFREYTSQYGLIQNLFPDKLHPMSK